ncbi:thiaminase II [bacterium]|nr:MAG: thiaminase II [bacterium]
MTDRFSSHLRELADGLWRAQLEHPFVRGIADGSLDLDKFRHWIRQDYRFLIDYCRLLALAAARSPDLDTLARFADLLQSTARTEMELHRAVAAGFRISAEELEAEPAAPVTQAYTDFLIRAATTRDFAELAAALLPCMWGFSWLGRELGAKDRPPDPRLAAWIDSYASPEFGAQADWCRELVDRLGAEASGAGRHRMEAAFIASSRHELAFWEMCWTHQGAPSL